ncbi:MAG: hypothetical protein JWQ04_2964 [Pedosphaera sp.]|nr:hypothetical protein [Pedosphaera sp.]
MPERIRDSKLPLSQFRVLCQVASRCGKDGECFESLPSMATACCIRRDTVQNALELLVVNGWLIREQRPGRTTVYRLSTFTKTGSHAAHEWLSSNRPATKQNPIDNDENENDTP